MAYTWTNKSTPAADFMAVASDGTRFLAITEYAGVYESLDHGATFTRLTSDWGSATRGFAEDIAYDATAQAWLVVGSSTPNGTNSVHTFWKSTDNGRNWVKTTTSVLNTSLKNLCVSSTLAVAVGSNSSNNIYRSTDHGASWATPTSVPTGLTTTNLGTAAISGSTVVMGVGTGKIMVSTDGGATFPNTASTYYTLDASGSSYGSYILSDGAGTFLAITSNTRVWYTTNPAGGAAAWTLGNLSGFTRANYKRGLNRWQPRLSRFLLVGSDGKQVVTSPTGATWTVSNIELADGPLTAVPAGCWDDTLGAIYLGHSGNCWTSTDGLSPWTDHSNVWMDDWEALAWDGLNNRYFMGGGQHRLDVATADLSAITRLNYMPYWDDVRRIVQVGSTMVAVGNWFALMTSHDHGSTWTTSYNVGSASGRSYAMNALAGHDGTWLAVGNGGSYQLSTNDGDTWTAPSAFNATIGDYGEIFAVLWDAAHTQWLAVGYDANSKAAIWTISSNLATWTNVYTGTSGVYLYGLTLGNGKYVAVGDNNTVVVSSDTASWSVVPMNASVTDDSLHDLQYGDSVFLATGYTYSNVYISADAQTWTEQAVDPDPTVSPSLGASLWDGSHWLVGGESGSLYLSASATPPPPPPPPPAIVLGPNTSDLQLPATLAKVELDEVNGSALTFHGVYNLNYGRLDRPNLEVSPETALSLDNRRPESFNSFVKCNKLHFLDLKNANAVHNLRVWMEGGSDDNAFVTNLTTSGYVAAPYVVPHQRHLRGNAMPTVDPGTANLGIGGSLTGQLTEPGYSDLWLWQYQVNPSVLRLGKPPMKVFSYAWDETYT